MLRPDFFEMTYTINRGLEYDTDLGCIIRKNPEVTDIQVREIIDCITKQPI